MTITRFPNKAGICIAFGDNCICLGKVFKDGFGAIFGLGMRKPIIWKVKN